MGPPPRCSRTVRAALEERQLDDFGLDAGLADRHPRARLRFAADDRERDRAEGGRNARGPDPSHLSVAESDRLPRPRRGVEAKPAQVAVRLALVVEPRDRLLPDVAALGEVDGPLIDPG